MAINVTFNNITQANSEILKAFNSSTSAKALEAYQPLTTKQRKLEKLRALQILKQSSQSATLADISLETDSLSIALGKADGATLQAMLNLLSAKMIEQNKYIYVSEGQTEDIKEKVKQKLENKDQSRKENKQESKKEDNEESKQALDKLVNAVVTYFEEIRDDFIEKYKQFLDAVSLENLQKAFKEGAALIRRYTVEAPIEFFNEYVVEPIDDFRQNLKQLIDGSIKNSVKKVSSKSFSSGDIKSMLNKSFVKNRIQAPSSNSAVNEEKLNKSVKSLNKSLAKKKKIISRKGMKIHSAQDIKLALHR